MDRADIPLIERKVIAWRWFEIMDLAPPSSENYT
jgi:hypothetical protein